MYMYPFYQSEWHDIPLASCAKLSCFALPDAAFYAAFYEVFFRTYPSFADLPAPWREQKDFWADTILSFLPARPWPRVLSVGCGVGYVESVMIAKRADIMLHCAEITEVPLRRLRPLMPEGRCHAGPVPNCLPSGLVFDLIYCGNMEYALPDADWLRLLQALRARLAPGGELVILSTSCLPDPPDSLIGRLRRCRQALRVLGHYLGLKKVQFWGWMRTVEENAAICRVAAFSTVTYGPLGDDPSCVWLWARP